MSFDRHQFRELISRVLRNELTHVGPAFYSPAAVELLMGTAAVESHLGTYIHQLGGGPALGVMQMEPETFRWIKERYLRQFPMLSGRAPEELLWDLRLAILTARLRYWIDPTPLPEATNLPGLARTWKRVYNTAAGAGTDRAFIDWYRRLCL